MADRLTQLQDAVDELATQFVASLHYIHRHHDYQTLHPLDTIRPEKKSEDGVPEKLEEVEPHPPEDFKAGQRELAQDLILKEQQIEYLISVLPGLENSEKDQEERIVQLQQEVVDIEVKRQAAYKEREILLEKLDNVIKMVKRP